MSKNASRSAWELDAFAPRRVGADHALASRGKANRRGADYSAPNSFARLQANAASVLRVAVIDGPYDPTALSGILAQAPIGLGNGHCGVFPNVACDHGTFILGLLGARPDAIIPGLCPDCQLLHIPLFVDERAPTASVSDLARAIEIATSAGAKLINLSLAVLGADAESHRGLGAALDFAKASGAVVVVAAGNQGLPAVGQLISHSATIPVVAVDALRRPLRDCNFGPTVSRRGVAAIGYEMRGYAPRGGIALMSGTSVATAVATGILAQLWSHRPQLSAAEIHAAVTRLGPRDALVPPIINRRVLAASLSRGPTTMPAESLPGSARVTYVRLQGEPAMSEGEGLSGLPQRGIGPASSGGIVSPAHGEGCACGAPGGICTCADVKSVPSRFIYVLGTIDIRFPDQSISEELQRVAERHGIELGVGELRTVYGRVLREPDARYVARQVRWILKVEGLPVYCLSLRDLHDLPDLIGCLEHPDGDDLDLIVGSSSLVAVETAPGLAIPILAVDQLASFRRSDLVKWVRGPSKRKKSVQNTGDSNSLFSQLVQSADNLGDTDERRALNYLAVNYPALYERYAEMSANGWILDSIKVAQSRLGREKRIVDPVFAFRNRQSGTVQKYFVRVDVSHLFPVLIHPISEYFDR